MLAIILRIACQMYPSCHGRSTVTTEIPAVTAEIYSAIATKAIRTWSPMDFVNKKSIGTPNTGLDITKYTKKPETQRKSFLFLNQMTGGVAGVWK